jgi:hypothetical protein
MSDTGVFNFGLLREVPIFVRESLNTLKLFPKNGGRLVSTAEAHFQRLHRFVYGGCRLLILLDDRVFMRVLEIVVASSKRFICRGEQRVAYFSERPRDAGPVLLRVAEGPHRPERRCRPRHPFLLCHQDER